MLVYGNRVNGVLKSVPETLGYTKPSEVYELHIQTEQFPEEDESTAIDMLMTLEQKFPDLQILHAESDSNGLIKLQFMDKGPGQISFGGLFSAIPAIFIIVGIILVGYLLWQVYQTQPIALWAVALIGGVIAFFLIAGERMPKLPEIGAIRKKTKESKTEIIASLEESRKVANQSLRDAQLDLNRLSRDLKATTDPAEIASIKEEIRYSKERQKRASETQDYVQEQLRKVAKV